MSSVTSLVNPLTTAPIATRGEVSALVDVPAPRLTAWARPTRSGREPLIHTARYGSSGRLIYPLVGIAEASTLSALRSAGLSVQEVRHTADFIRQEFGNPYALASPQFVTDGTDAFVQDHMGLRRVRDDQFAIREAIKDHLKPLIIGPDGFVQAFRVERYTASEVTIDPRFNAGQMSFVRNRIPVFAVAGPLLAGEADALVMSDFGLTESEVADVRRNLEWFRSFI